VVGVMALGSDRLGPPHDVTALTRIIAVIVVMRLRGLRILINALIISFE
jgi:hypothetical protein